MQLKLISEKWMNEIYWMYLIRIELNLVSEKIMNKIDMLIIFILKKGGETREGSKMKK